MRQAGQTLLGCQAENEGLDWPSHLPVTNNGAAVNHPSQRWASASTIAFRCPKPRRNALQRLRAARRSRRHIRPDSAGKPPADAFHTQHQLFKGLISTLLRHHGVRSVFKAHGDCGFRCSQDRTSAVVMCGLSMSGATPRRSRSEPPHRLGPSPGSSAERS